MKTHLCVTVFYFTIHTLSFFSPSMLSKSMPFFLFPAFALHITWIAKGRTGEREEKYRQKQRQRNELQRKYIVDRKQQQGKPKLFFALCLFDKTRKEEEEIPRTQKGPLSVRDPSVQLLVCSALREKERGKNRQIGCRYPCVLVLVLSYTLLFCITTLNIHMCVGGNALLPVTRG